jgi:hypothetical protein
MYPKWEAEWEIDKRVQGETRMEMNGFEILL